MAGNSDWFLGIELRLKLRPKSEKGSYESPVSSAEGRSSGPEAKVDDKVSD